MIAHSLVFGPGVSRPKIKQVKMRCIRTGPEGDSYKAWHPDARRRVDPRCNVHLNRPIAKLRSLDQGQSVLSLRSQTNSFSASIFDCFRLHILFYEVLGVGESKDLRGRRGWSCTLNFLRSAKASCRPKEKHDSEEMK